MSSYEGPERRNGNGTKSDLRVLSERLSNFMDESVKDRRELRGEIFELRKQTHEWMQTVLDRLPPWALAVGSVMTTALGAMAMYIATHR